MRKGSSFILALALVVLASGCKSDLDAEFKATTNSSLRLFEESSGQILDLKKTQFQITLDQSSLNPLSESLSFHLRSEGSSFLIKVPKTKIAPDGKFELDETDVEQPIKLKGQIVTTANECSLSNLLMAEKITVKAEIFKGFSGDDQSLGKFETEFKNFEVGLKKASL